MAAEEVIHFLFRAQPSWRLSLPAVSPSEPVAKPPPLLKTGQSLFLARR
jgi:hypothetical protein